MFGRRRRPLLGAAVVVGASRSAARREVQRQSVMETQREMAVQQEIDMRRRQEEDQERRTQRAVDEAVKKAVAETQTAQQAVPVIVQPPAQQYYNTQQPTLAPAQGGAPPPYMTGSPSQDGRPKSAQGIRAEGAKSQFCAQCGFACQLGDRFCRQCGSQQV